MFYFSCCKKISWKSTHFKNARVTVLLCENSSGNAFCICSVPWSKSRWRNLLLLAFEFLWEHKRNSLTACMRALQIFAAQYLTNIFKISLYICFIYTISTCSVINHRNPFSSAWFVLCIVRISLIFSDNSKNRKVVYLMIYFILKVPFKIQWLLQEFLSFFSDLCSQLHQLFLQIHRWVKYRKLISSILIIAPYCILKVTSVLKCSCSRAGAFVLFFCCYLCQCFITCVQCADWLFWTLCLLMQVQLRILVPTVKI